MVRNLLPAIGMDTRTTPTPKLELSLVEIEPPSPRASAEPEVDRFKTQSPAPAEAAAPADLFLAAAKRELADGKVDDRLWARALELAEGDTAAATAGYLRARATALRVARREPAPIAPSEPTPAAEAAVAGVPAREAPPAAKPRLPVRTLVIAGAAVLVGGAVLFFMLRGSESVPPVAAPAAPRPAPSAVAAAAVAAPQAATGAEPDARVRELEAQVEALARAGNWNVLVLHAAEWTRRDPDNAAAWKQLAVGYTSLRQFDDAYAAADKAARLLPDDRLAWKTLGQAAVSARRPEEALKAFEKAIALDGNDVPSIVLSGLTNLQLGRLVPAKTAFDRALVASPGNADALCGQALLTHRQAKGRDADPLSRNVRIPAGDCGDPDDPLGYFSSAARGGTARPAAAR
jgi:tetratricopeptide (TPR) repeat protein